MNSKNILLVDDDPMSVEFMKIYLESKKFKVVSAYSFSEAKVLFIGGDFSTVITDVQLSDGSGIELAKIVRETSKQQIKIIAVTGYAKADIEKLSSTEGIFDALLRKPIDLTKLFNVIES